MQTKLSSAQKLNRRYSVKRFNFKNRPSRESETGFNADSFLENLDLEKGKDMHFKDKNASEYLMVESWWKD